MRLIVRPYKSFLRVGGHREEIFPVGREDEGPMKNRMTLSASAGEEPNSAARGVVWLILTLLLCAAVFLPILAR
jgi:hypothetical protein